VQFVAYRLRAITDTLKKVAKYSIRDLKGQFFLFEGLGKLAEGVCENADKLCSVPLLWVVMKNICFG
jgi:hypothetical protein